MANPIIDTSIFLSGLHFRPLIDCDNASVTVTLRPDIGGPVTSTAATFALAWTSAIVKMKSVQLISLVEDEADYRNTIADFMAGTGRL